MGLLRRQTFQCHGLPLTLTVNQMDPLGFIWFHLYTVRVTDLYGSIRPSPENIIFSLGISFGFKPCGLHMHRKESIVAALCSSAFVVKAICICNEYVTEYNSDFSSP